MLGIYPFMQCQQVTCICLQHQSLGADSALYVPTPCPQHLSGACFQTLPHPPHDLCHWKPHRLSILYLACVCAGAPGPKASTPQHICGGRLAMRENYVDASFRVIYAPFQCSGTTEMLYTSEFHLLPPYPAWLSGLLPVLSQFTIFGHSSLTHIILSSPSNLHYMAAGSIAFSDGWWLTSMGWWLRCYAPCQKF